jgi:alkanesulfonate monooxygenase SsuD/methylene tetrahydromethanopterin reductase-like flavin-dependent oxidoreductase (luciferase family)
MRFGVWYHLRNPARWAVPRDRLYSETLEQIVRAEELGYDSVWTSEHHFTEDGYLPSSLLLLAAVASRTRSVRLGTLVLLLPLHHPLRVAEDAAVLDILSGGRLDLGVAAGYRVEEFQGFEIPKKERGSRMDEALEILQRSWSEGAFSFSGKHYRFENLNLTPKPLQNPLPLYVGGQSRGAIERAARFGCHLLPSFTGEFDVLATYHQALRRSGRDPARYRINCFRPLYCCEDARRGWEEIKEHYLYQHNLYRRWYREAGDGTVPELSDPDELPRAIYIVGTPDDCARAIEKLRAEVPFDEFIFWAAAPGFPLAKAARSLELFAREVMPRFAARGRQ